jgi:ADP-ribose pyrophosphatase YjhB (NUDIX family)
MEKIFLQEKEGHHKRVEKDQDRAAAIIETPYGVLMVKEIKPEYIKDSILAIQSDTYKTAIQKVHGINIVEGGIYGLPGGTVEPGENPETTIIRELGEELALHVEPHHITQIMEIVGKTRRHLIYLVRASGVVMLAEHKFAGVGLLKERNLIPIKHEFVRDHVRLVHDRYVKNSILRNQLQGGFISSLYFNKSLLEDWFRDEQEAFLFRSPDSLRKRKLTSPVFPRSLPNFNLLNFRRNNEDMQPQEPQVKVSLTKAATAQIIPPEKAESDVPSEKRRPHDKKKSNPRLQAVSLPVKSGELLNSSCPTSDEQQCSYGNNEQPSPEQPVPPSKLVNSK